VLLQNANLISVAEAARICNVTVGRIRQLIDQGRIVAEHVGQRSLVVDRASAQAYADSPRKPGPKAAG